MTLTQIRLYLAASSRQRGRTMADVAVAVRAGFSKEDLGDLRRVWTGED